MISPKTIEATIKYFYRQEGIISDSKYSFSDQSKMCNEGDRAALLRSSQLVVKSEVGFGLTLI